LGNGAAQAYKGAGVIQDRFTANEVAGLYLTQFENVLLSAQASQVAGAFGKIAFTVERLRGNLDEISVALGADIGKELKVWGSGAATQAARYLGGAESDGSERPEGPINYDDAVAEKIQGSIWAFNANNATLPQLSYLIAFNMVSSQQRGTRVVTGAAIDKMEQRLGIRSARSLKQILASVQFAKSHVSMFDKLLAERFKRESGGRDVVRMDPRQVSFSNSQALGPSAPQPPSGPLDALNPQQAPEGQVDRGTIHVLKSAQGQR